MIDAFIINGPTLRIIRSIQSRLESSPGIINGWPCRYPACQVFNAGTMQFRQLLGSPAGKWISELLLSYENPHRLGRKLITGVAVWTPMQELGCDQPALVWEIQDWTAQLAQTIFKAMTSDVASPDHGSGLKP